jgi:prolyl-tRNA synthetase
MAYVNILTDELRDVKYYNRNLDIEIDDRDIGGAKGWDWIYKCINF